MLIIEHLKAMTFSDAENQIADYLIKHPHELDQLTTQNLANFTHTNPNSVIRLAKKLGFDGWTSLRTEYQKEWQYLNSHFNVIDANIPFDNKDDVITIMHKLAQLEQNTISDTVSLVERDVLVKAQSLLLEAKQIIVFASLSNANIAKDFVTKMRRIGMPVTLSSEFDSSVYEAYNAGPETCGIIISYTGENTTYIHCGDYLKRKGATIISLTNMGDNQIASMSNCNLSITTRERLYSKIGNFTSNTSIIYLLDLLYSIIFAANYEHNLDHLIRVGQAYDGRITTNSLIEEASAYKNKPCLKHWTNLEI